MQTPPVPEAGTDRASSGDALLQVTGLVRHFPVTRGVVFRHQVGAVQAVDGINLSVARGQTLGLVGESGCGKTTTGRLLTRLDEPTSGQIVIDGHDVTHLSPGK
ncbi:MAG: ATP-binding cassette domain-containing protein, partial [Candidatus Dormiibacterota bacterium]